MPIKIITDKITLLEVKEIAKATFGDMAKAVVDIEKQIMAIGGEIHADAEQLLLENGSRQENLWGINIYPENSSAERIQFESLINIRPAQNNRAMTVQDEKIRQTIAAVVNKLIT